MTAAAAAAGDVSATLCGHHLVMTFSATFCCCRFRLQPLYIGLYITLSLSAVAECKNKKSELLLMRRATASL